jgi:hypothetical protein
MKINWNLIMTILFGIFISVVIGFSLFGCKSPKTITKTEWKTIRDTLIINGDTIIRNIEVNQDCPECKPKTRFETRLEYRLDKRRLKALEQKYKDSLNTLRKMNESNNKAKVKLNRTDKKAEVKNNKNNNSDWWKFWAGFGACFAGCGLTHFVIKKLGL